MISSLPYYMCNNFKSESLLDQIEINSFGDFGTICLMFSAKSHDFREIAPTGLPSKYSHLCNMTSWYSYIGSSFYQIKTGDKVKAVHWPLVLTQSTHAVSETSGKVWAWVLFCICCSAQLILHSRFLQTSKYVVCNLWFCYLSFVLVILNGCVFSCWNSRTYCSDSDST